MTMMQWFRSVRSARGVPASWRPIGRRAAVALFVLIGLSQAGCQSGLGLTNPCGSCGSKSGCGSGCGGLTSWSQRLFNRGGSRTIYGAPVPSAVPVEGMPPGAIVTPAPAASGSTLLPGPAESATTPQLDPIPSATPGPPSEAGSSPTGAKSPTGKTNYEAARPRYRGGRFPIDNDGLARTLDQAPEPTTPSARGSASAPRTELDLVTNLPPLELPHDARRPTAAPAPAESAEAPTPPAPSEVHVAPIARFTALDGRLSGGALPTSAGLDWLVEKGYKTILDLREPSERQPSFIAEVTNRGLRYVALPISVKTVDADHLSHFNLELAMADARPLYFFDTDGTRAGVLWYVRRLTQDKVDPQVASREAEELGLDRKDRDFWRAAQSLVENPNGAKPAPEPPKPAPAPAPADAANAPAPAPATTPDPVPTATPEPAPTGKPEASIAPAPLDTLAKLSRFKQEPTPPSSTPAQDPTAWRPYLAMVLTALGVPLAYLGRTGLHGRRVKKASLPGTGRRPRSLPAASGE